MLPAQVTKEKVDKLDIIHIKIFVPQKTPSRKCKDSPQIERTFLQIIYLIKDLCLEYIKNSYNSIIKRQISQLKMGKGSEWTSLQRRLQIANKDMQRCSTSYVIREMQVEKTMR